MTTNALAVSAHYPTSIERQVDQWVHLVGLGFAFAGGGVLLGLSIGFGTAGQIASVAIYGLCLALMFLFSILYNMGNPRHQPVLRRLDHAGIFLMIAGSYTPFTTQSLEGGWAIGMTTAVWSIALLGVAGKLFLPGLGKGFWVVIYLALGWIAVIAIGPLVEGVSLAGMILLGIGGVIYSAGVVFYVRKSLKFRRAIWHGFVLVAAGTHYAAIMTGVVLFNRA